MSDASVALMNAAKDFCDAVELRQSELDAQKKHLDTRAESLMIQENDITQKRVAAEAGHEARVKTLEAREASVASVRTEAAQRLARCKTLEQNVAEQQKLRVDAEQKMKKAIIEKKTLEATCATLLEEKKELEQDLLTNAASYVESENALKEQISKLERERDEMIEDFERKLKEKLTVTVVEALKPEPPILVDPTIPPVLEDGGGPMTRDADVESGFVEAAAKDGEL